MDSGVICGVVGLRRLINPVRLMFTVVVWAAFLVVPSFQEIPATAEINPEGLISPMATNDRLGMVFISSAEVAESNGGTLQSYRFDRAVSAGAGWDRLPLYWDRIEGWNAGGTNYNWTWTDAAINADSARGLQINAILVGTPSWATTALASTLEDLPAPRVGEGPRYLGPVTPITTPSTLDTSPAAVSPATTTPQNLYLSVFSDGTDTPGPYKQINQNNYWARFVNNVVNRYKTKVKVWEMWNEPDLRFNGVPVYWSGSVQDYYRLLKVGYLAAKHADPSSTVLMGGIAYWSNPTFFEQVLQWIKGDSAAAANNHYFDATAWHWYSRSSQMYDMVNVTRNTMAKYGLANKPIWVNETGVPIWDDPTKPPFGGSNSPYFASATMDEAASYITQAIAYGLAANVQRIFHFQECDDGNAETFGLLRNDNSTRPSFTAYQVASQYLRNFTLVQKATDGAVERIIFWGTPSGTPYGKVTVLWNTSPTGRSYTQTAAPGRTRAYLVDKAGSTTNLSLTSSYSIWLPGATDNNGLDKTDYIIGGNPFLLVEEVSYALPFQTYLPLIYKNSQGN